jgi:hypothetical protein
MTEIYYVEFYDAEGGPFRRKPFAFYAKPGTAKGSIQKALGPHFAYERPAGARLWVLQGELTLVEEYGTIVEHCEGQEPLF